MMHASYVPGEAWCVVRGDVLVVLDRGLDVATAIAIHTTTTAAELRDEPLALAVLEPTSEGWLLWRRRGVPAVASESLPGRAGEEWGSDLLSVGSTVAFGAVAALVDALPIEGGVVRASAVRVELVADGEASETAAVHVEATDAAAGVTTPLPTAAAPARAAGEDSAPGAEAAGPLSAAEVDPESEFAAEAAAAAGPATEISHPDLSHPGIAGMIDSVPGYIQPAAVVEVPDLVVGDHDGMTIAGDPALALAAAAREEAAADATVLGLATGPVVLSSLCEAAHVNPPGATTCACGEPIQRGSSDQRPRPEFAELVLPAGERVPLGRGVVLGRRPGSRRVEDGRVPRLVTVHSPGEDISRSHLEVRCEDWNVLAVDLDSTNGTVLLRDGVAPMRLRPNAPQLVAFGDRLDLGDGVVVRVEPIDGRQAR